jgi:hypothetical protein
MKWLLIGLLLFLISESVPAQPGNGNGGSNGHGQGDPCSKTHPPPGCNNVPINTYFLLLLGGLGGFWILSRQGRVAIKRKKTNSLTGRGNLFKCLPIRMGCYLLI